MTSMHVCAIQLWHCMALNHRCIILMHFHLLMAGGTWRQVAIVG